MQHSDVSSDLQEIIQRQAKKDAYCLSSGKIHVPRQAGNIQGYADAKILVQSDADFYIYGVTGSYGYWSADKSRLQPLPDNGFEEVVFKMSCGDRLITSDYVAVETFFTGGSVGKPLCMVMPLKHIVMRGSFIRVEFQNATKHDFEIDFTLHGVKYF